jgi:hypothetical protein
MNWLIDLGELENDVSHRPGKLYKFNISYLDTLKLEEKLSSPEIITT